VNSAASLAVALPVGRVARISLVLGAYAVPAALAWGGLGLALTALPVSPAGRAATALAVAAAYGCCYGTTEASGRARPRPPGSSWQVPQRMLIGAGDRRRVLTWGVILGPGFLTRNPYAGFGLLPVLVACAGPPQAGIAAGLLIGVAHGSGRALALLRDARAIAAQPFDLLLTSLRWRVLDGLALLLVAGAAIGAFGFRLG
jgi:hypothetical protein